MDNFHLSQTAFNPLIDFNIKEATLKIEGNWFSDIDTGRKITDNFQPVQSKFVKILI